MIQGIKNFVRIYSTFHVPDKRNNIFLFSSPRSGSTWLLEILMMEKGYKWVREPFNLRNDYVRRYSGINNWDELYNKHTLPKIEKYITALAGTNIRDAGYRYPYPFSNYWHLITRGTMFKILHACEGYIDHLKNKFNGKVIFLIRHPIPVTLSRDSFPRLQTFVNSDYTQYFTTNQIHFAKNIIENGSSLEKGVVDWALQNAVPLKQRKEDWIVVTYEDLVLHPLLVIDDICNRTGFTNRAGMLDRLYIASGSSVKSKEETKKIILDPQKLKENKQWLLEKWRKKVKEEDLRSVQTILDVFEINIYRSSSSLPAETISKK